MDISSKGHAQRKVQCNRYASRTNTSRRITVVVTAGHLLKESEAVHKNNSVSGRAAGWLKKVRLETFFFHFCKIIFFFLKVDNIFLQKKKLKRKKKKIAAARLAFILATRWTGNTIFFMDSLRDL